MNHFQLQTPSDISRQLSSRCRELRLRANWKRETLAARAGVSEASLKRFENTGQASLDLLLRVAQALGRLHEFNALLMPPPAQSLDELERLETTTHRKRGTR